MTADPAKIALYCQGTFSVPNPDNQQIDAMIEAAADIASSGFGTVLLGQWHVHENGDVYYNDSPLDSVIQALKVIPTALTQGTVENVLISFGPFAGDFQHIQSNLAAFQKTMDGVRAQTAISGYDWDLEGDYESLADLLVQLTDWAVSQDLIVTAAPYQDMATWKAILKRTNTAASAGFAWWNLQLYGGADYGSWAQGLQGVVPDPQSFLVPGYAVHLGATPQNVQEALTALRRSSPGVDGGFVWQYEDIVKAGYTAKQFADAIRAGLGG